MESAYGQRRRVEARHARSRPQTTLQEQTCPPDRIVRTIIPKLLKEKTNWKLYDCGENITGWVRTDCDAEPGKTVQVRHSEELTEDGLVLREEEGGRCLGEWCTPPGMEDPAISPAFVNTCFYIRGLYAAEEAARILNVQKPSVLEKRREKSQKALVEHFFDSVSESFCCGENGADAFALQIGLGTEKTRRNLVSRYETRDCLDTGIFGTPVVLEQLFALGRGDLPT